MTVLTTPRLHLRELNTADVTPEYVAWLNDPEATRFLEIRHGPRQTPDSVRAYVSAMAEDQDNILFGAFEAGTGQHIGNIKIGPINHVYAVSEIGLVLGAREARGRGYGVEMLQAMLAYSFDHLGLRKLRAHCYEANVASLRIFRKVGFSVEGFLEGHAIYEGVPHGLFALGLMASGGKSGG